MRNRPNCHFSILRSQPHSTTSLLLFIVKWHTEIGRDPLCLEKRRRGQ